MTSQALTFLLLLSIVVAAQPSPHPRAHAHNDYEHARPLFDALSNGFTSVEADVHLTDSKLLVSHNKPGKEARTLEQLYLKPLDSLVALNGAVYRGYAGDFYLMIDIKTEANATFAAIHAALSAFPRLQCLNSPCPVKIFVSGNRPYNKIGNEGNQGLAFDGRPEDLGKGYTPADMPVISDHYKNWSKWSGSSKPTPHDLQRIRDLAKRVHAEGKKLRLWAIPDNEEAWEGLMGAGVDLINSDRLAELNAFLMRKGM